MEARDLMMGDWVDYNGTYQQVEEVDGFFNQVYLTLDEDVHCHDISPIPITHEILLANGFTYKPQMGYVSSDGRIILDDRFPNYPRKWHAHIDNEDYQSIASCDLDYLHQLQNLLRICNIEKEWKL